MRFHGDFELLNSLKLQGLFRNLKPSKLVQETFYILNYMLGIGDWIEQILSSTAIQIKSEY